MVVGCQAEARLATIMDYHGTFDLVLKLSILLSLYNSLYFEGRRGDLMVSALVPGASGPGSCPGRGHCALNSHSASLHPGV